MWHKPELKMGIPHGRKTKNSLVLAVFSLLGDASGPVPKARYCSFIRDGLQIQVLLEKVIAGKSYYFIPEFALFNLVHSVSIQNHKTIKNTNNQNKENRD